MRLFWVQLTRLCTSLLFAMFVVSPLAYAGDLPRQRHTPPQRNLLACPFAAPNDDLGYAPPAALSADNSSDDGSSDDDDDSSSSSSSDGAITALQLSKNECLFLGGSVTFGAVVQHQAGPSISPALKNNYFGSNTTTAELDVAHVTTTEYGDLITRFGFSKVRSTDINAVSSDTFTMVRASVAIGPWLAGLEQSTFDTWTGDPFANATLTPVATTGLIARQFTIDANSTLSLAIEDPATQRVAEQPTFSGQGLPPDMVARYRWANSQFDVILTAATHVVDYWRDPSTQTGDRHDMGFATKAYVKYTVPTATDGSYVLAQATYGQLTPAYLGIATDSSRRSRFQLAFPPGLTAQHFEHGSGWSADVVGNYAINDQWQTAVYGSYLNYGWYSVQTTGEKGNAHVQAFRTAWNATYTPVTNLSIAGELGYGFQQANKLEGKIYPVAVGNSYSATMTVNRSF